MLAKNNLNLQQKNLLMLIRAEKGVFIFWGFANGFEGILVENEQLAADQ
jgi:hypothetical protein